MSFDLIARKFQTKPQETPELACGACEGGGWECYGLGFGDPHFKGCETCHNPEGHPRP